MTRPEGEGAPTEQGLGRPTTLTPAPQQAEPRAAQVRTVPGWRAWQLSGLLLAALSLAGYWTLTSSSGEVRRLALAAPGTPPHFTLLLAGRDIVYCYYRQPCADQNQKTKLYQPPNTDTIMLIKVDGTRVNVLSIPRDTNVGPFDPAKGIAFQKVNSQYFRGGPEALVQAAEQITGEHVDSYMIVRTDYVAAVVDALGGLDVTVPDVPGYAGKRGIQFDDNAADLHVHLDPGPHHLDGKTAVAYLRMRKGFGDDYGRMDHQKQALTQLLDKLRGPGGLAALPTILRGLTSGSVETDVDPALAQQLLPFLHDFKLSFATLPTTEIPGTSNLAADQEALAGLWGTPETATSTMGSSAAGNRAGIRILDSSGSGQGERLGAVLKNLGYPVLGMTVQPASRQGSQVFTLDRPTEAGQLADLLGLPRLQGLRFAIERGEVGLYLGQDSTQAYAVLQQLPLSPSKTENP